ncbi:four helix bundle protein [Flavobacterium sp.]|jgi:four helix bundle protein|uniref:four helix bundle protein n=1 Tax=Flavobacterium sp. TaxID=239 RepID=UPI00391A23E3
MAKYSSFEEMEVYQKALQFGVKLYKLTLTNEKIAKDYGLKDQLQRVALSISNNIAEGFERETKKELIRFLYFSKGSAGECRNMFNFLKLLEYINEDNFYEHRNDVIEISKQLGSYIKYLKNLEKHNKKA